MGYIKHHAIVVTSPDEGAIASAHSKAVSLGMYATPVIQTITNKYSSFAVLPDGSKEGWTESGRRDASRARLIEFLRANPSFIEWAEMSYGSDDAGAAITNHAWSEAPQPEVSADAE